jgi:hypothetical protein
MTDSSQLVVAKGGRVHVAPSGTPLPGDTDPREALDAAFLDVGYVTEDGVTLSGSPNVNEFMAWQSGRAVRRDVDTRDFQLSFTLEQWNGDNLQLAFGGGSVEETDPGVFRYDFPGDEDALDENAIVVDWEDRGRLFRTVWERGNVMEGVETNLVRTGLALLPVVFKVLEPDTLEVPGFLVTDDDNFAPGS